MFVKSFMSDTFKGIFRVVWFSEDTPDGRVRNDNIRTFIALLVQFCVKDSSQAWSYHNFEKDCIRTDSLWACDECSFLLSKCSSTRYSSFHANFNSGKSSYNALLWVLGNSCWLQYSKPLIKSREIAKSHCNILLFMISWCRWKWCRDSCSIKAGSDSYSGYWGYVLAYLWLHYIQVHSSSFTGEWASDWYLSFVWLMELFGSVLRYQYMLQHPYLVQMLPFQIIVIGFFHRDENWCLILPHFILFFSFLATNGSICLCLHLLTAPCKQWIFVLVDYLHNIHGKSWKSGCIIIMDGLDYSQKKKKKFPRNSYWISGILTFKLKSWL